jgi:hypothetical protein
MTDVLTLQELPAREKEDESNGVGYSTGSWQTCL